MSDSMRSLSEMTAEICAGIDTIFTDIDDTLTTNGRLPAAAYSAMWNATNAGVNVVLVTGRPAGWCDMLARQFPVAGVVGENGALCFAMRNGEMKRIFAPRPANAAEQLKAIEAEVLASVPGCKVAADQAYRLYDLAIDFCEEVPALPPSEVDRIWQIFEKHGATAKISSIHVNGWYGDFDKLTGCHRMCSELLGAPLDVHHATFVGDSPNDVPMFKAFPYACGVHNVASFTSRMAALPAFIAPSCGGEGFAEIVAHILANR